MSNPDFLGRAIETVKKAIESDTAGEYDKASQTYYQACRSILLYPKRDVLINLGIVELFMLALKCSVAYIPRSSRCYLQ